MHSNLHKDLISLYGPIPEYNGKQSPQALPNIRNASVQPVIRPLETPRRDRLTALQKLLVNQPREVVSVA
jgi:hypothetical protein